MSKTKKIVLITGANKGIGFEIARQLGVQDITILVVHATKAGERLPYSNCAPRGLMS